MEGVEASSRAVAPGLCNCIRDTHGRLRGQFIPVGTARPVKLILASASPRRAEILRDAGIAFEVHATFLDETRRLGELRGDYIRRLALDKARAASAATSDTEKHLFLGADTVVVVGDELLGKPNSADDARRMLRLLSGRTHQVHTAVALVRRPRAMEGVIEEVTDVTFAPLSDKEIDAYIATGEPFDKAGAYAIQGVGGRYITPNRRLLLQRGRFASWRGYGYFLREFGWTEEKGK